MHFGKSNRGSQYFLKEVPLDQVSLFKDLGVTVSSNLKFDEHITATVAKANRILGMLKKSFVSRDPVTIVTLYKSHVRPILEFNSIIWCPYRKYLLSRVEAVQKRFCNFFSFINHLDYRNKLSKLGLLSLEARRLRYKLFFLYKVINGRVKLPQQDFLNFSNLYSGEGRRLLVPLSRSDYRRYFFTVDVVSHWNSLTVDERSVASVALFKSSVCSYFRRCNVW